jgi:NAD(P)-dependent dehydrogenase (short-subunit alcohol dehydrogenase family)
MKNKPLFDQIAVVTGGGTGIGRVCTEALAAEGAKVIIASRRADVLRRASDELNQKFGSERVFPFALPLCVLCVLCVSVVDQSRKTLTTEAQRTQRTHRDLRLSPRPY